MRALVGVVLLMGCSPSTTIITGSGGGSAGASGGGAGGAGGSGGATAGGSGGSGGASGCPDDAKVVYVVDADRTFSSFDPRTKMFHDIGVLNCPAGVAASPFSMSVARDATAYVLYDDGELFQVSTSNLACTKTTFSSSAYRKFGMGFSTDVAGGTTDTLFIAGGQNIGAMSKLARLDLGALTVGAGVDIVGWPELTGTGDAELWGFFPETAVGGGSPFVARFDKMTGAFTSNYPASMLSGAANAWAFAFWGGSFWIFLERDSDNSTNVWEMKASTGAVSNALMDTGRKIVGAGVSTCAPITIN